MSITRKNIHEISDIRVFLYNQTFYLGSSKQSSYMQKNINKPVKHIILSNLIYDIIQYQICRYLFLSIKIEN